jgi:hypothetical protein
MLAIVVAACFGACRSGTNLEGEPVDSANADDVLEDLVSPTDGDASPDDGGPDAPDTTDAVDDAPLDDAAEEGEAVAPGWPCTAGVPARPCRPALLPLATHEMAGRVVGAAFRPDGSLGVVSDRTSFAWGFDTALAFLEPAPGISAGPPETIWTSGFRAVADWSGTEFGVALAQDDHGASWDLLRVAGDGAATLTATLDAGCNHLLWTGSSWVCLFPDVAPLRVRELAPDGTLLGDATLVLDGELVDVAWGGGALGILFLDHWTGLFYLTVVDADGRVLSGPTVIDALTHARWFDGLVLVGSPAGFAILYFAWGDYEHYTSGTMNLVMRHVGVQVQFLDATGLPVGAPAAVAEALTFDSDTTYGETPTGAVLSDDEAVVAWRDLIVYEDPSSTPPVLRTTSWFRIASATSDGAVSPPVDLPSPASAPNYYVGAPTLARSGRSLALLWSYFCVDDGQDCVAAAMGCCE